jgi:hypothetical protein
VFSNNKLTKSVAAGAAVVVIAAGGLAIGNSSSGTAASGAANAGQAAAPGHTPRAGQAPRSGQAPQAHTNVSGQVPANWNPGDGTVITGATADQVKAAALAKYPGTVNRVLQLSDGSYAVHYFNTSGPHHVFVSKTFQVTGAAT